MRIREESLAAAACAEVGAGFLLRRRRRKALSRLCEPGSTLQDNYRVERLMQVWPHWQAHEATDLALGRKVVLIWPSPEQDPGRDSLRRILERARRAAASPVPGETAVFAAFEQGGQLFLVLEKASGTPLEATCRRILLEGCAKDPLPSD